MDEFEYHETMMDRPYMPHIALVTVGLLCLTLYFVFRFEAAPTSRVTAKLVPVMGQGQTFVHAPQKLVTPEAHILFVGDMFFDRQIRFVGEQSGVDYPFSCVDSLLQSADMVVGNLEGPVTDNPSVSLGTIPGSTNNYKFTFPTTTPATLLRHNVRVVSLSNNHILNFDYDGVAQTHHYLALAGLGYFGGVEGNEPVYRVEQNDIPISFIGYNEFGGSTPEQVAATIAAEHVAGRTVVVFAHWGDEYSTNADRLRPIAALFAESGASAVIGAHPHVVGQKERIGNTVVYYSLGNFIFDQYFSWDVMHGLAVALIFSPSGIVEVEEYPVALGRDGRTCLSE